MISINLLDNRRKEVILKQKAAAKATFAGIAALIVGVIVFGIVVSLKIYMNNKIATSEKRLTSIERQITTYQDVFSTLEQVKEKVESIGQIIATRAIASEKIELFFNTYSSNLMEIKNVGLGGAANPLLFEISGSVDNIAAFRDLNVYFKDLAQNKDFDFIVLQSLGRSSNGDFQVRYIIKFSDKKITS